LRLLAHAGMRGRHRSRRQATRCIVCIGIPRRQGPLEGMDEGVGGRQDMLHGLLGGLRGGGGGLDLLGGRGGRLALARGARRGRYGRGIVAETHLDLLLLLGLVLLLGEIILLLLGVGLADARRRALVLKG
jgi:hypothetical protein